MKLRAPVLLLLALGMLVVPAPAQAAACSGGNGVTVVVQYSASRIEVGCAGGDPADGMKALEGAGFSWTAVPGVQGNPVCQINGFPAERSRESCWTIPQTWSYWYAKPGGPWTKSGLGAANRDPAPGTVEGWRFGTNAAPSIPPPGKSAAAPTPTPKPTPRPTPRPTLRPATTPQPSAGASGTPTGSATPTATATSTAAAAVPTATGSTTAPVPESSPGGDATGAGAVEDGVTVGEPTELREPASSDGLSWIWGVVLVGVLAAAGAASAVLRRRS